MAHPVEKVRSAGNDRVFLTERGASFGYNNLVVDYRALPVMRALAPVVFDGTHSVQQPSAANGVSGGQPSSFRCCACGSGSRRRWLFLEVHDDPPTPIRRSQCPRSQASRPAPRKLLAIHKAATPQPDPRPRKPLPNGRGNQLRWPRFAADDVILSTSSRFLPSQPAGILSAIRRMYCGSLANSLATSVPFGRDRQ